MTSAAPARTHALVIRLPEGVDFSLPLAGPMLRFLARAIDFMAEMAILSFVSKIVFMLAVVSRDLAMAIVTILYFLVPILYGIAFEWWMRGQTLGKRVMRLRVLDASGLRLRFSQVVMRNLLRAVDSLPALYLLGGFVCLASRRCQRLGDLAAGTIVVRLEPSEAPDLSRLGLESKFNTLREHPLVTARLRQQVDPATANTALRALLRRDQLEPTARLEVFAALAEHFRSLVKLPEEIATDLSDEALVRAVVDVVFAKPR
ncbi:MAG: RDD family protein [Verrucomicrobia bacterium]|nr:RDD family protein [Verrucomicrobiota bacterium]